jgi:ketosteroid isomerase-like protein
MPSLMVGGALVVLLALAGVIYAIGQNALAAPLSVANTFCTDLKAQRYSDAYALLSSGYQSRVDEKTFTQLSQVHDQLDGKVQGCGPAGLQTGGFTLNLNPQDATINAQMTRKSSYSGVVSLVKQNGDWRIDALGDSLQGSDVGGLATTGAFCKSLASQDYAKAYGMFTPAYQQQIGSADSYANGLKKVFGGGQFQITGCEPKIDTYTVTAQGDTASVSGALNIKVTTEAGTETVPVPFKLSFAKIAGTWKISDLEVVQSQG